MLSGETYGWGQQRVKRLSRAELQKIKKNMKKVPLIQKKSAIYHQTEAQKAELLLQEALAKHRTEETTSLDEHNHLPSDPWYLIVWEKIKKVLWL